jgi:hypothetical protein
MTHEEQLRLTNRANAILGRLQAGGETPSREELLALAGAASELGRRLEKMNDRMLSIAASVMGVRHDMLFGDTDVRVAAARLEEVEKTLLESRLAEG